MRDQLTLQEEIIARNDYSYKNYTKPDTEAFNFDAYIDETLAMAKEINFIDGIYSSRLIAIARIIAFGDYTRAYNALMKISHEQVVEELSPRNRMTYYGIMVIYYAKFKGELESAIHYAEKELAMAEAEADINEVMRIKMNIGTINVEIGYYDTAKVFLTEAYEYYTSVNDAILLSYCYVNLGKVYIETGDLDKAKSFYSKAIELAKKEHEVTIQYDGLIGLSEILKREKNYEKALELLEESMPLIESIDSIYDQLDLKLSLINIYKILGRLEEALSIIVELSGEISQIENKRALKSFYKDAAEVYSGLGQVTLAYKALEDYVELVESEDDSTSYQSMNKLIQEEYKKNLSKLETIATVGRELTMLSNVDQVLLNVERELSKVLELDVIGVGEVKDERVYFNHYFSEGKKAKIHSISLEEDSSLAVWCVKNKKEIIINDIQKDYGHYIPMMLSVNVENTDEQDVIKSLMYAPLKVNDEILGVFTIQSYKENAYTSVEVNIFQIITDYVAIAVKNVIQRHALELLSVRDYLTNMYNRRGFTDFFEEKVFAKKKPSSVAIIMLDLDYFKTINDHYGHLVGDEMLCHIASCLMSVETSNIRTGRLGGEEFGIIVFNESYETALTIAERLRERIENLTLMKEDDKIRITTSVGVTYTDHIHEVNYNQLYFEADNALYKAKEQGRNRVCVYSKV